MTVPKGIEYVIVKIKTAGATKLGLPASNFTLYSCPTAASGMVKTIPYADEGKNRAALIDCYRAEGSRPFPTPDFLRRTFPAFTAFFPAYTANIDKCIHAVVKSNKKGKSSGRDQSAPAGAEGSGRFPALRRGGKSPCPVENFLRLCAYCGETAGKFCLFFMKISQIIACFFFFFFGIIFSTEILNQGFR